MKGNLCYHPSHLSYPIILSLFLPFFSVSFPSSISNISSYSPLSYQLQPFSRLHLIYFFRFYHFSPALFSPHPSLFICSLLTLLFLLFLHVFLTFLTFFCHLSSYLFPPFTVIFPFISSAVEEEENRKN